LVVGGAALATAAYGTYVGLSWLRYGKPAPPTGDEADPLLDRFIPEYDVVERHSIEVAAPAAITLAAAREQDLGASPVVRAIFKLRELAMGSGAQSRRRSPAGLLDEVLSLGWGVLAETEGREIVVGAVTKPWEADVVFTALPPEKFASFREPGFVKIAWTLRTDALGPHDSVYRTETRAVATDESARAKFRRYWSFVSPGVWLIRRLSLHPLRKEAERRAAASGTDFSIAEEDVSCAG
jgi:hypothetical protein